MWGFVAECCPQAARVIVELRSGLYDHLKILTFFKGCHPLKWILSLFLLITHIFIIISNVNIDIFQKKKNCYLVQTIKYYKIVISNFKKISIDKE